MSKEEPYLLVSNQVRGRYVALSHCWGSENPLLTTLSTLDARTHGIPMETLPKMFQDAIVIARQLGINYVWIDSLCIIQDSDEDWSREAAVMGDIYRFSYLTIFVLDAKGCHEGILVPRIPAATAENGESRNSNRSYSSLSSKRDTFKKSVLCHRAWALQERLLSPRIVYYGKDEVFWECLACTAREGSTTVKSYRPSEYSYADYQCADVKNRLIKPINDDRSLPFTPPLDWHIIVAEYTRCNITRATDRLPAISGLASIYQENTGHTYTAGLWKESFQNDLLWFAQPNQVKILPLLENSYLGPTWSWVSCPVPIMYETLTGSETTPAPSSLDIQLVDSRVVNKDMNSLGELVDASVTVQAVSAPLLFENAIIGETLYLTTECGTRVGIFLPDNYEHLASIKNSCTALWVTRRRYMAHNYDRNIAWSSTFFIWTYFLVIAPATETTWRRIGLGKTTKCDEIFNDTDTRTVFQLI